MQDFIRNVAIIAHVDHGKSTLADRLIERCGGLSSREMKAQVLDSMGIERERGITIKAQTVRLSWRDKGGLAWTINLLDTPGHVDFSYEVSRALAACEGSLLVVDATQGVEAQTLANTWTAVGYDHGLVVALNKMDLASADKGRVCEQLQGSLGIDGDTVLPISAKTGAGIDDVLQAMVSHLPCPQGDVGGTLRALVVDSWYDNYVGVVILVRVVDGVLKRGERVRLRSVEEGKGVVVEHLGVFTPKRQERESLQAGEIGFIISGFKHVQSLRVGDTVIHDRLPLAAALPGFRAYRPAMFCGLFPQDQEDYPLLRDSLAKLVLNDSAIHYTPETSTALGHGFRCGFLGLLHLDIALERLRREFGLELVVSAPQVVYRVSLTDGSSCIIDNPSSLPEVNRIRVWEEPWVRMSIMTPEESLGATLELCQSRRGRHVSLEWIGQRAHVEYMMPLSETIYDFHDTLQSLSSGYASFNYQFESYEASDLVKISILINDESVDALSFIAHRSRAQMRGRSICMKLKEMIPRHLFKVAIQAAIGGKIIARETVPALRKDVTAKCYGGDVTRRRKLLEKQKEGKKRMKAFGKVSLPNRVFIDVLKS
ncbi:MAG: elongation factor 4 [Alphaproteobacteria bacterium GM7ARS4]|nr:elongation factor 4 [Alphaproteobacteria bacterium GM7ARS4]